MPISQCECCGSDYTWSWEEAFDKFGFNDGDSQIETETVANVLRDAGYETATEGWGLHNIVIVSIRRDDVELIPNHEVVHFGYASPRNYLPAEVVELLDRELHD